MYTVVSSSNFHLDGGEFDHLIAYSMACTIKNDDEYELKHGAICFESLDEGSKWKTLCALMKARECSRKGPTCALNEAQHKGKRARTR